MCLLVVRWRLPTGARGPEKISTLSILLAAVVATACGSAAAPPPSDSGVDAHSNDASPSDDTPALLPDSAPDAESADARADAYGIDADLVDATTEDAAYEDRPALSFDDHSVNRLTSISDFEDFATPGASLPAVKFSISQFGIEANRAVHFLDSGFYSLHDEWHYYRLLNGRSVPGDSIAPLEGSSFPTIASIYTWARMQTALPLELAWTGDGRLYSPRYYARAFGTARVYGLGSVIRVPARTTPVPRAEMWAFELEYEDAPTHAQLVAFFETLSAVLPVEIGSVIKFLVRSPGQEVLASTMERDRLPYWDRLLRLRDVVVPGAKEVYAEGIAAGRVRFIRRGDSFDGTSRDDVLVFEDIPDRLPPGAAVVTAVPQTPLAHINILARNRGIPNAHVAGVLEDTALATLARIRAPVIVHAVAPDRVSIQPITETQYARYRALLAKPRIVAETPAPNSIPYFVDLETTAVTELDALGPTIGGKSVGMLALAHVTDLERPYKPQGMTVRAYSEHFAPFYDRVASLIASASFLADARARYLTLEGVDTYRAQHVAPADVAYANTFLEANPAGTPNGDFARSGGVKALVRDTPIAPATLTLILDHLRATYESLAVTQGIRFRSSSNVEDIEGFNGAGLYDSQTGFIDAAAQRDASDRARTVSRAITRVWASYWGFEAFEERRLENVDHLSGAMGVLVHPRFDDPLERSTGVFTMSISPPEAPTFDRVLELNVQKGAESVANPDPTKLPEVDRVTRARGSTELVVTRIRRSTLSPDADLLSDAELRGVFEDANRTTEEWLARQNSARPATQAGRTLTLDFEFHDMFAGWPAFHDRPEQPARFVFKQTRTLEPAARTRDATLAAWPIPRDVFVRARRIERHTCTTSSSGGGDLIATVESVLTDSSLPPDVGYGAHPFLASFTVATTGPVTELGYPPGLMARGTHLDFVRTREADRDSFTVAGGPLMPWLTAFVLADDGAFSFTNGASTLASMPTCGYEVLLTTPRDYLLSLLTAPS